MNQRWITGNGEYNIRILNEFSCTDLIGEVFYREGRRTDFPPKPVELEKLDKMERIEVSGLTFLLIYNRTESDARGPYVATAMRIKL